MDTKTQPALSHERVKLPEITPQAVDFLQNDYLWKNLWKPLRGQLENKKKYLEYDSKWNLINAYISKLPLDTPLPYRFLLDLIHGFILPSLSIQAHRINDSIVFFAVPIKKFLMTRDDVRDYLNWIKNAYFDKAISDLFTVTFEDTLAEPGRRIDTAKLKEALLCVMPLLKKLDAEQIELFLAPDGNHFFDQGYKYIVTKEKINIGYEEIAKNELIESHGTGKIDSFQEILSRYLLRYTDSDPDTISLSNQEIKELVFPSELDSCLKCYDERLFSEQDKQMLREAMPLLQKALSNSTVKARKKVVEWILGNSVSMCFFYPPTEEEGSALLYCYRRFISKRFISKISINFDPRVVVIKYFTAQYMILTSEKFISKIAQEYSYENIIHELHEALSISNPQPFYGLRTLDMKRFENEDFLSLRSVLGKITSNRCQELILLLELMATILLGPYMYKKLINTKDSAITVIITKNPQFVSNFIKRLCTLSFSDRQYMSYQSHSFQFLAQSRHIPDLLLDQMQGIMVNITTDKENQRMPGDTEIAYLKKIFQRKKVSLEDKKIGDLFYRNAMHHIYISEKDDFPQLLHPVRIQLSGNISQNIFRKDMLSDSEVMVFNMAAILYVLMPKTETQENLQGRLVAPSLEKAFDEFIKSFYTLSIPSNLPKEPKSTVQEEIEKEAKALKINELPYDVKEDFEARLKDWYKAKFGQELQYQLYDVSTLFKKKYSSLLYIKRNNIKHPYIKRDNLGKKTHAKVFYGIKINEKKFAEELKLLQRTVDEKDQINEFDDFFDKIILNGKSYLLSRLRNCL